MTNEFSLEIPNVASEDLKVRIAVEIIKKVLFKSNSISSKELASIAAINRSVCLKTKID